MGVIICGRLVISIGHLEYAKFGPGTVRTCDGTGKPEILRGWPGLVDHEVPSYLAELARVGYASGQFTVNQRCKGYADAKTPKSPPMRVGERQAIAVDDGGVCESKF